MRHLLYFVVAIFFIVAAAAGGFFAGCRLVNLERYERRTKVLDEESRDDVIRGQLEILSLIRLGKSNVAVAFLEAMLSNEIAMLFVCTHESCVLQGIASERRLETLNQVRAYFDTFPSQGIPGANLPAILRAIPKGKGVEMNSALRELLSIQAKSD